MLEKLLEEVLENKGKVVGVLLGLTFGWLTIRYGFFATLFIFITVTIGYIVGKRVDEEVNFKELVDKFFGPKH